MAQLGSSLRIVASATPGPSRVTLHRIPRQIRLLSIHHHSLSLRPGVHRPLASQALLARSNNLPITSTRYASTATASSQTSPSSSNAQPDPNSESNSDPNSSPSEPEPQSAYARFKALSKKYGWWAVAVYALLSPIDFGFTFFVIHTFGADRFEPWMDAGVRQYRLLRYGEEETNRLEEEQKRDKEEQDRKDKQELEKGGKVGNGWGSRALWAEIGLAYAIHKTAFLPIRAGLTVAWTPKLVGWLTKRGWVGKGGLTRAKDHAQERIKGASDRVRSRVRPAKE